jgi:hypothetical protein
MRRSSFVLAVLLATAVRTVAVAQDRERLGAIYDASATVETNIPGVRTFNLPPKGFDVIKASDEELATYGFPPRPNQQNDPKGFAQWAKAMAAIKTRWNGELKHTGAYSRPAERAAAPAAAASAGPTTYYYYNWSGFVNTNTLTKYNSKMSFYYVISDFNVPYVKNPACDGGLDWQVSWNGIDGNQDGNALLQGGSSSAAYCNGSTQEWSYFAWIEWWPAYDILAQFEVNPGDDMFVQTWDTSATQGYVFLVDLDLGIGSVYGLTPNGGPGLIGNSAEYIVERPCCVGDHYYPLPNYIWNFWANSWAFNFITYDEGKAATYYPGLATPSTLLANMVDDNDDQVISAPTVEGKYGIFFETENCAVSGTCTP